MWNLSSGEQVWSSSHSPYPADLVPGYPFPYQPQAMYSLAMGQDLGGHGQKGRKRRRLNNPCQRKAANIRERTRMLSLNDSFDRLRTQIPTFPYEKSLSRIETLRLAISYISFMSELLSKPDPQLRAQGGGGLGGGREEYKHPSSEHRQF